MLQVLNCIVFETKVGRHKPIDINPIRNLGMSIKILDLIVDHLQNQIVFKDYSHSCLQQRREKAHSDLC